MKKWCHGETILRERKAVNGMGVKGWGGCCRSMFLLPPTSSRSLSLPFCPVSLPSFAFCTVHDAQFSLIQGRSIASLEAASCLSYTPRNTFRIGRRFASGLSSRHSCLCIRLCRPSPAPPIHRLILDTERISAAFSKLFTSVYVTRLRYTIAMMHLSLLRIYVSISL